MKKGTVRCDTTTGTFISIVTTAVLFTLLFTPLSIFRLVHDAALFGVIMFVEKLTFQMLAISGLIFLGIAILLLFYRELGMVGIEAGIVVAGVMAIEVVET